MKKSNICIRKMLMCVRKKHAYTFFFFLYVFKSFEWCYKVFIASVRLNFPPPYFRKYKRIAFEIKSIKWIFVIKIYCSMLCMKNVVLRINRSFTAEHKLFWIHYGL